jgi:hypothetical protein
MGITNWTTISNKEMLVYNKKVQPVHVKMSDFQYDRNQKSELMDPNHTHFLLVDNSRQNFFGGETEYRARLESYLNKTIKVCLKNINGIIYFVRLILSNVLLILLS